MVPRDGRLGGEQHCGPKRLETAEDWAPFAVPGTEPDADGWYPEYRTPPPEMQPEPVAVTGKGAPEVVDSSWFAIVAHWHFAERDLADRGVNLFDPAVLAQPWPWLRVLIEGLLDPPLSAFAPPTRLRAALTTRR